MHHKLFQGDCLKVVPCLDERQCIFADPPDNIGLGYSSYDDSLSEAEYVHQLYLWIDCFINKAPIVWFSFNARWTAEIGFIAQLLKLQYDWLEVKPCIQVFTFGQHNHHDLGNNHRPVWRFMRRGTPLYPDAIRVPSWRQLNGDKRADPRGRVPGDVFDFPRVTGNSKQRRPYHPTQLHEGLVERCVLLSTKAGEGVLDPFGGTATTLRVCKKLNRPCALVELDELYCSKIAEEHGFTQGKDWNVYDADLGNEVRA